MPMELRLGATAFVAGATGRPPLSRWHTPPAAHPWQAPPLESRPSFAFATDSGPMRGRGRRSPVVPPPLGEDRLEPPAVPGDDVPRKRALGPAARRASPGSGSLAGWIDQAVPQALGGAAGTSPLRPGEKRVIPRADSRWFGCPPRRPLKRHPCRGVRWERGSWCHSIHDVPIGGGRPRGGPRDGPGAGGDRHSQAQTRFSLRGSAAAQRLVPVGPGLPHPPPSHARIRGARIHVSLPPSHEWGVRSRDFGSTLAEVLVSTALALTPVPGGARLLPTSGRGLKPTPFHLGPPKSFKHWRW